MKTPFLRLKGWLGSFGVRARLLTLLLPGILSLLALDSSNDYQSLQRVVNEAYDEAMLESEIVLRRSVSISKNGQWQLNESYGAQEILSSLNARHRYFHIGLTPHDPSQSTSTKLAEETTLLGQADFPSVPAALFATTPSSSTGCRKQRIAKSSARAIAATSIGAGCANVRFGYSAGLAGHCVVLATAGETSKVRAFGERHNTRTAR